MKTSKKMLWMLLALVGMVALVSCSSDDDFDGNASGDGVEVTDENDMSDDGEVLSGEEFMDKVQPLIVGTYSVDGMYTSCSFSYSHFQNMEMPDYSQDKDLRFVFTERDQVLALFDGAQVGKPFWYDDGSYTFGEEWTINYAEDLGGKIYKFYRGEIRMAEPLHDDSIYGEESPVGRAYVINVREDGYRMVIEDSFTVNMTSLVPKTSSLTKVADSDRVVVE